MSTKTLYFDESGFTGYNLLDPDQPIFTIASCDLTDDEAHAILGSAFPRCQAPEFKFANIWASKRHRAGLVEFGAACSSLGERVFISSTEKKFAALTKILDFFVEPVVHASGYDFYAEGFCWKYSNYVHYALEQFAEPALYDALVGAYQEFSRNPTNETLTRLRTRLEIMAGSVEGPVRGFLAQMADGVAAFTRLRGPEGFRGADELHVTNMIAAVCWWRQRHKEDFAVIHDESAHFFRHREMWENATRPDGPTALHRGGDSSDVEYPLRVISTKSVRSHDSAAVQFCDIIAGLSAKILDKCAVGQDRDTLDAAIAAGLSALPYNGVRFEPVFPDQFPPPRRNGPDAVDKMARQMFGDASSD